MPVTRADATPPLIPAVLSAEHYVTLAIGAGEARARTSHGEPVWHAHLKKQGLIYSNVAETRHEPLKELYRVDTRKSEASEILWKKICRVTCL